MVVMMSSWWLAVTSWSRPSVAEVENTGEEE